MRRDIFQEVKDGLQPRLAEVVEELLPGGRMSGKEYLCASLQGGPGESCRTNLHTGVGSDFATGETWPDIIGLAAKVWNVRPREAAERLAERYGLIPGQRCNAHQKQKESGVLIPIPLDAPDLPKAHYRLGRPTALWQYYDAAGNPLFYVMRFETLDKGKAILPLCLRSFPDGTLEWRWEAWPAPRPLYDLSSLITAGKDVPVLLVEGEKTADAALLLFPDYLCTTWSGGCQALHKTDFSLLRGRNVVIWPDNDDAGREAAKKLANILGSIGAGVRVVPLPSILPPKWDLADAPPEGFDPQWYFRNVSMPEYHARVTEDSQSAGIPDSHAVPTSFPLAEETEDDFIRPWPVLHSDGLPGIVGRFVELATRSSEADRAAVLITLLTRFGVEVYAFAPNQGPYIRIGETVHPPRIYGVIAGASAKARKGTSAKPVLRLFTSTPDKGKNAIPPAPHTGGPLSSGEGLAWRLRERDESPEDEEDKAGQHQDKRLFVLDEELAAAMASIRREGNTLSMAVRSLWDSGDYEPLTKNAQISVRCAHVGIVTHITIPEVRNKLDSMQISNGFANRFLWICARRTKQVPCPEAMPQAEFQSLHDAIWQRVRLAQNLRELRFTPEARDYWIGIYSDLSQDMPGIGGDIVARSEAQCVRLALIYALLDGKDCIETPHLKAALALWRYARESALYIFGNMKEEEMSGKIYAALRESPKSTTELYTLFNRHIRNDQLKECLQELIGRGLVEKRELKTAGRPKIVYCCAKKENKE